MAKLKRSPGALLRDFGERKLGTYAAAGTFYLFLSLPSIIMIVVSVMPYTNISPELMERLLTELFPSALTSLIESIVASVYNASRARLSLSIVLTVWTASLCMAALMRGLRVSYNANKRENYLVLRIKAFFYMLLLFAFTFLTFGGIIFSRQLIYLAIERFDLSARWQQFAYALGYWRYLILLALETGGFMLLYRFCSGTKIPLGRHWPGAVFSAVVWLVFSYVFSLYVNSSGAYSVYGIVGTVLIAMLWVYYSLFFLLIGGYLNRILYEGE